jgi:hypothetical protein
LTTARLQLHLYEQNGPLTWGYDDFESRLEHSRSMLVILIRVDFSRNRRIYVRYTDGNVEGVRDLLLTMNCLHSYQHRLLKVHAEFADEEFRNHLFGILASMDSRAAMRDFSLNFRVQHFHGGGCQATIPQAKAIARVYRGRPSRHPSFVPLIPPVIWQTIGHSRYPGTLHWIGEIGASDRRRSTGLL